MSGGGLPTKLVYLLPKIPTPKIFENYLCIFQYSTMNPTGCRVSGLRRASNEPSLHGSATPDQRGSTNVDDCGQTSPTHHNIAI